jgi:hypothetical protein
MNGTRSEAQDNHLHKHETLGFSPGSFYLLNFLKDNEMRKNIVLV